MLKMKKAAYGLSKPYPWACCLYFDEPRKAGVVCLSAAEAGQTLIIKVLRLRTDDLLEARGKEARGEDAGG
jgi:hypothetical protein